MSQTNRKRERNRVRGREKIGRGRQRQRKKYTDKETDDVLKSWRRHLSTKNKHNHNTGLGILLHPDDAVLIQHTEDWWQYRL